MNDDREHNPKLRFNLQSVFATITILGVLLAIPVIGVLLLSAMVGVVVFLGLVIAVQFPIFMLIRRQLIGSGRLTGQRHFL